MRLAHVLVKNLREMRRDLLMLALTLAFAPFFVFIYWMIFGGSSATFEVLVIDRDRPVAIADGGRLAAGDGLVAALRDVTGSSGRHLLKVAVVNDRAAAERSIKDRAAAALLIVPPDFSRAIAAVGAGGYQAGHVVLVGDLTNPSYAVAAVLTGATVDSYVRAATDRPSPISVEEQPLGSSGARSDFETAVPGIMVISVILLVFLAAMTVAREVEAGTLRRLQITRMTSFDLLGGISASLVLVGIASVLLTFLTAWALGFHSRGPLWVAILVAAVTSFAIIGTGLMTAAFARTVAQAFVIANFPLGLLMFFSGAMFPMPRTTVFTIAGHGVSPFDLLPPTHAVIALNKVLTLGEGLGTVTYELSALVVLSALYFWVGVWLFKRLRMRAA